jgi:hypothetical protein
MFLIFTTIIFSLLRAKAGQATDMYPTGAPCISINELFYNPDAAIA